MKHTPLHTPLAALLALCLLLSCAACQTGGDGDPVTWQEQYDLGAHYLSEGNFDEAILAFQAAIDIDPKQADAYLRLAEAYMALGGTDQAAQVLSQGLRSVEDENGLAALTEMLESLETPDLPGQPDTPDAPDASDAPDAPDTSDTSDTPDLPGQSDTDDSDRGTEGENAPASGDPMNADGGGDGEDETVDAPPADPGDADPNGDEPVENPPAEPDTGEPEPEEPVQPDPGSGAQPSDDDPMPDNVTFDLSKVPKPQGIPSDEEIEEDLRNAGHNPHELDPTAH